MDKNLKELIRKNGGVINIAKLGFSVNEMRVTHLALNDAEEICIYSGNPKRKNSTELFPKRTLRENIYDDTECMF